MSELDLLVFTGEPVRNPSGERQVSIQSAVYPLLCPRGSLGCLFRSGHHLLCSRLLPGSSSPLSQAVVPDLHSVLPSGCNTSCSTNVSGSGILEGSGGKAWHGGSRVGATGSWKASSSPLLGPSRTFCSGQLFPFLREARSSLLALDTAVSAWA